MPIGWWQGEVEEPLRTQRARRERACCGLVTQGHQRRGCQAGTRLGFWALRWRTRAMVT